MSNETNETRKNAIEDLHKYIVALREAGYNDICIRDSVVVASLDALECYL